ncbi:MAG: Ppx/GppA family phosphatase, partial [Halanaerobiaceae bacterium]
CAPVNSEEINVMKKVIRDLLRTELDNLIVCENKFSIKEVTGLGGTITTLAAIEKKLVKYDRQEIHNHSLSIDSVKTIMNDLAGVNLEQRKKIRGLQPGRADIIVTGTVILLEIMAVLGFDRITVSEHDLLYGVIYQLAETLNEK